MPWHDDTLTAEAERAVEDWAGTVDLGCTQDDSGGSEVQWINKHDENTFWLDDILTLVTDLGPEDWTNAESLWTDMDMNDSLLGSVTTPFTPHDTC